MMSKSYDVIVIGLGSMGSAALAQVAQRGKNVLGIEQFYPAHNQGSGHGKSRVIRQAYFEGPEYVPLLLRSYELWEELEKRTDRSILTITGGLMMGRENSSVVQGSLLSAQTYGLLHEVLTGAEINRRFPPFRCGPEIVGLWEHKAGFVHPEESILGYLSWAEQKGAKLQFGETLQGWEANEKGEGVRVKTNRGDYWAHSLILAPGAWAPQVFSELKIPLEVERQVLYWFRPTEGFAHFHPDQFPIYIWEMEDGVQFYGFPAQGKEEEGVKVAYFRMGNPCTPQNIQREVADWEVERMKEALRGRIPSLMGPCVKKVTCMYTNTPDQHFVISQHPQYPQVALAGGFSGHGFKFASVVGEILADLALERKTSHPIELFAPRRFL